MSISISGNFRSPSIRNDKVGHSTAKLDSNPGHFGRRFYTKNNSDEEITWKSLEGVVWQSIFANFFEPAHGIELWGLPTFTETATKTTILSVKTKVGTAVQLDVEKGLGTITNFNTTGRAMSRLIAGKSLEWTVLDYIIL